MAGRRHCSTGVTNAPLLVSYAIGGTAVNGVDYNAISNFVVIPIGASSATVTLVPKDDAFVQGSETISISLTNTPYYSAVPATNLTVTISDDEPVPPPLSLRVTSPTNGVLDLTLDGPAIGLFNVETSSDFNLWQSFATLLTVANTARLFDLIPTNAPYLFFRARQQE